LGRRLAFSRGQKVRRLGRKPRSGPDWYGVDAAPTFPALSIRHDRLALCNRVCGPGTEPALLGPDLCIPVQDCKGTKNTEHCRYAVVRGICGSVAVLDKPQHPVPWDNFNDGGPLHALFRGLCLLFPSVVSERQQAEKPDT